MILSDKVLVQHKPTQMLVYQTQIANGHQSMASNMKIQFVQKQPSRSDQL